MAIEIPTPESPSDIRKTPRETFKEKNNAEWERHLQERATREAEIAKVRTEAEKDPRLKPLLDLIDAQKAAFIIIYDPNDPTYSSFWDQALNIELKLLQNAFDSKGWALLGIPFAGDQGFILQTKELSAQGLFPESPEREVTLRNMKLRILTELFRDVSGLQSEKTRNSQVLLQELESGKTLLEISGPLSREQNLRAQEYFFDLISFTTKYSLGVVEMANFLVEKIGVDVNDSLSYRMEEGPVITTAIIKYPELFELFLKWGVNFNIEAQEIGNLSLLHKYAGWGEGLTLEKISKSRQLYPDKVPGPGDMEYFNKINPYGWTPLHNACFATFSFKTKSDIRRGYPLAAEILLEGFKVDPFVPDKYGYYAIEFIPVDFEKMEPKNEVCGELLIILRKAMSKLAIENPTKYRNPWQKFLKSERGQKIIQIEEKYRAGKKEEMDKKR